jgi:phage shock protein A
MFDENMDNNNPVDFSPEGTTETVQAQAVPAQSPKENSSADLQERNIRALRQKTEQAERERDELRRKLQEIEAAHTHVPEEDDEVRIGPDELAEGKHLTKVGRKIKKLEEQLKQYQQQTTEMSAETRLRTQYPDFDAVVSKDNIDQLRQNYPEIANTLNTSNDLYSKAVTAYTLIKKLGIQSEDPYKSDRELAQKNAAKPRPLTSIAPQQGDSPLSHANAFANGLTDDLRKQLHKEMVDAMKSR